MKVLVLGGFLGSGKTTLLMQLAHYLVDKSTGLSPTQVVILENEIGQEGIDDQILRGSGFDVENLFQGCACCTLAGELVAQVRKIENTYHPEWLIVETTGLAYPGLIQDNLKNGIHMESRVCTVTDASRWKRLKVPMAQLFEGQIERADVVIINKADLASEEDLQKMESDIREMNKDVTMFRTSAIKSVDGSVWEAVMGGDIHE